MNISRAWLGAIVVTLVGFNSPVNAADNPRSVVGTWRVTSLFYRILDTNEEVRPFGDAVTGFLNYTSSGRVSVFLQKKNPPSPSDTDFSDAKRAQLHKEIIGAYAGRYSVEGNKVTHHIEVAWRPDWIGQDQVRYINLQADELTIETAPVFSVVEGMAGRRSVATLTFKRVE